MASPRTPHVAGRARPHCTKRQKEAAARFAATIQVCAGRLPVASARFEPLNFADWMMSCDTCGGRMLQVYLETVQRGLASAGSDPSAADYVLLRTHFRDYAEAAMKRRWPDHPSINVRPALADDDIPF